MNWLSLTTTLAVGLACFATSACGGSNNAVGDGGSGNEPQPDSGPTLVTDSGTGTGEGGGPGASCGQPVACGGGGVTYEECTTTVGDGQCVAIVYQLSDGHSFTCAGCTSCGETQQQLASYCSTQPTGDAGHVDSGTTELDSGTVDSGSDSGGQGGTTCLPSDACGSGGLTYSECTTTNGQGTCTSIAYRVSNGNVYTCNSCSDCSLAIQSLNSFCAQQGPPVTTCTVMAECESSPLTYETCTTSLNGTCQSVDYQTSDGHAFTCNSCSDCSAALSSLDAYCTSQTPPVTTCGIPVACGIEGATYEACTTSQGTQCDSADYTTSTGHTFTCNSCSDCTTALTSLETYCASLVPTGGVVMFGGFDTSDAGLSDTWLWNGSTWTASTATGPVARGDAVGAMLGGRFVFFGGIASTSATTSDADTWEWTGSSWLEVATTGPAGRFGSGFASMGSSELVLFGGDDNATVSDDFADTWIWNGVAWSESSAAGPSARVGAASATLNGQVVLFGGLDTSGVTLADTWVFNGTQWTQITPATSPPARYYPSMVTFGGEVLLFGGGDGTTPLNDTWVWNGVTWTELSPATSPSARGNAAVVAWNGGVVLFGGVDTTELADTWVWNGSNWLAQSATGPAARFGAVMGTY